MDQDTDFLRLSERPPARRGWRHDHRPSEGVRCPSTLVRCTVDDVAGALRAVDRVLAPGGRFLLIEHVRAEDEALARRQDRLHRIWRAVGHGCHCNLDTTAALAEAGFDTTALRRERWRDMPAIVSPLVVGTVSRARRPAGSG